MRRLFLILAALTTGIAYAQTPPNAPRQTTGTATHVPNAEIQAALAPLDAKPVADVVMRLVAINGEYNVGVSVVRRTKVSEKAPPDALMHHEITEVYHVLEGSGILVTGGIIEGEKEFAPDSPVVRTLVGPTSFGTAITGGTRQRVGAGDVVIIPPNTPHGFSEIISDHITYLLVRVDPHRVIQESERKR